MTGSCIGDVHMWYPARCVVDFVGLLMPEPLANLLKRFEIVFAGYKTSAAFVDARRSIGVNGRQDLRNSASP